MAYADAVEEIGGKSHTAACSRIRAHVIEFDEVEFVVFELEVNLGGALAVLTAAERAIASMIASGISSSKVAKTRGVARATVATQIGSIYRKLGVHSRVELALLLLRGAPAGVNSD